MTLRLVFVNFGKLLDEFTQFVCRYGEEGEERVKELCGVDVRAVEGRHAIAEQPRFDRVVLEQTGGPFHDCGVM